MSDEQRKQFERWAGGEGMTLRSDRELGRYIHPETEGAWQGYSARDAEVQALRERNECLSRAVSFFASSIKSGEQWSAYHEEEMAALRGEEGTNHDL